VSEVKPEFHIHLHCLNRNNLHLLLRNCETDPVVTQHYSALTMVCGCHSLLIWRGKQNRLPKRRVVKCLKHFRRWTNSKKGDCVSGTDTLVNIHRSVHR